jgi:hypothetical protein
VTERKIYRLSALCGAFTALAFVVPRFVPSQEGGIAGAATAILVFLGMLLGAALFSIYLLLVTIQAYREISFLPRLAGIAPTVVLLIGLALLIGFLRF